MYRCSDDRDDCVSNYVSKKMTHDSKLHSFSVLILIDTLEHVHLSKILAN